MGPWYYVYAMPSLDPIVAFLCYGVLIITRACADGLLEGNKKWVWVWALRVR